VARILIVEDEPNARDALGEVFSGEHEVVLAGDVDEALSHLEPTPDLVLTDVVLPGERDGLDLVALLRERAPGTPAIVITAYASVDKAVRAMRDGAYDFLEKPLDVGRLRAVVASALRARGRAAAPPPTRGGSPPADDALPAGFVGRSPAIREVFRVVRKAAPTNATVLILGESGTGKELVAEAIHRASPRAEGPFVRVNCAALTESLLESELFGHAQGAFTGAVRDRAGRFEAADGGTLFLDEVGEVPEHTQVKLLRALQNREIERVGENRPRRVDVRVIAATNSDLEERVRKGTFREDFYFRLKVITLRLPPLRERPGDVVPLAEHFLRMYAERHGRPVTRFAPEALAVLQAHDWPGNVRELENVVEAAVVLSEGREIGPDALGVEVGGRHRVEDLPEEESGGGVRLPPGTSLPEAERRLIEDALVRTGGNKTAAARILGIGLRTLYRKLESYAASDERSRR
jgi:DNA-binding NtrC family response regulator